MNNMTGGTLPAATWHEIMQYAHSGVDLKPFPGATLVAQQGPLVGDGGGEARSRDQLTHKASDGLNSIEVLMKSTSGRRAALDLSRSALASAEPPVRLSGGGGSIIQLR